VKKKNPFRFNLDDPNAVIRFLPTEEVELPPPGPMKPDPELDALLGPTTKMWGAAEIDPETGRKTGRGLWIKDALYQKLKGLVDAKG
jgi:hypothetical protein